MFSEVFLCSKGGWVSLVSGPFQGLGVGIPGTRSLRGVGISRRWIYPEGGYVWGVGTHPLLTPSGSPHTYSQQAGSTHPTGMHSCLKLYSSTVWTRCGLKWLVNFCIVKIFSSVYRPKDFTSPYFVCVSTLKLTLKQIKGKKTKIIQLSCAYSSPAGTFHTRSCVHI